MQLKKEDKEVLIKTINKRGFLLENKAWEVALSVGGSCSRFEIIRPFQEPEDRVEIDVVVELGNKIFLIECKRTDYSWIFSSSPERSNTVNWIHNYYDEKCSVTSRTTTEFKAAWSHIPVILEEGVLKKEGKLAQTSYRDASDAVTQVLRESRAFICNPPEAINTKNKFIVPVVVTNNPLLYLSYSNSQINEKGDMLDYQSLEEIDSVIYNYPEHWGFENRGDCAARFGDGRIKSVFIVDIQHLGEFLKKVSAETLAGQISGVVTTFVKEMN